jgi:hypothetical protein
MRDEFNTARERQEAWASMLGYCMSRTTEQLAGLIANEQYRNNVFATYSGTDIDHARDILTAARIAEQDENAQHRADLLGDSNPVDQVRGLLADQPTDKPSPLPDIPKTCERCRFYDQGMNVGRCRRYPPSSMVPGPDDHMRRARYEFPEVSAFGWCGEFSRGSTDG